MAMSFMQATVNGRLVDLHLPGLGIHLRERILYYKDMELAKERSSFGCTSEASRL